MLLSYGLNPGDNLAKYRAAMPCGRILIDSGAFTAYTVGKVIKLTEYAAFLQKWEGCWDYAVTLDVIGDPVATRHNTHKLHSMGLKVLPVFTRGGKAADFDAMVRDTGYVCVGGGVGMPPAVVVRRLSALQRRAEELGGGIHALGVGNMAGLRAIRPYSADSSNVSSAFRFGTLVCYDGRNLTTVAHSDHRKLRRYLREFKAQGVDLSTMVKTGRQPTGRERIPLMHGLGIAAVCADEDTTGYQVPVPKGVDDTPGTHIYNAITGGFLAPAFASLDGLIHDPEWSVPLWDRYRAKHARQCRAPKVEEVAR